MADWENPDLVDMGGDITVEMWFYREGTLTERTTILQKNGETNWAYNEEFAATLENGASGTDGQIRYFTGPSSPDIGATDVFDDGLWTQISIKRTTARTTTDSVGYESRNGSNWVENYQIQSSGTSLGTTKAGPIQIGRGYANSQAPYDFNNIMEAGVICVVRIYNRLLSNAEIKQNFDAVKERFGIIS
jgi:hypothetical protein